ncbi:hypothetical protein KQH60_01965 [Mycetohabitans sp. B8]|uniref:hypothetical protein n=1 Tax=Mycetohabitans sp. B8 TaxID=2841845 RepID=UPI001F279FC6|nr:hypothetical protein [Mycetohabitans sp. B8]MCG1041397.1 hypothetical protein [Mycetohabitans sp. B8]
MTSSGHETRLIQAQGAALTSRRDVASWSSAARLAVLTAATAAGCDHTGQHGAGLDRTAGGHADVAARPGGRSRAGHRMPLAKAMMINLTRDEWQRLFVRGVSALKNRGTRD